MRAVSAHRRSAAGLGIFTLLMLCVFLGLGFWQLQRRTEKHALIAALTQRLAGDPTTLPQVSEWPNLVPARDEFRRVTFAASYLNRPDAMVYSSGSAIRDDIAGPGTWAFLPARLPGGQNIVVNTGFVQNTMQDRAVEDRAVAGLVTGLSENLTGYVRFPESAGMLTPSENLAKRLWFVRDHRDMAEKLGWGAVAPIFVDLEQPVPANGIPKPAPLGVHLKDDHLQYAITWFGLAGVVVVAFAVWLFGQRRGRAGLQN
jgi:cytochrome oxidase assembly protein ShyY1